MRPSSEVLDHLKTAEHRAVGTNQTIKAINRGAAQVVFVARDADRRVVEAVIAAATARGLEVVEVDSMRDLGRACGIAVGAASAAIVSSSTQDEPARPV